MYKHPLSPVPATITWLCAVLFALGFSGCARLTPAVKPQPVTAVSAEEAGRPLPGTVQHQGGTQLTLAELQEKLGEAQQQKIARLNEETLSRFTAIQGAGGWVAAFRRNLAPLPEALPTPSADTILSYQQFLDYFARCVTKPVIADETADVKILTSHITSPLVVEPEVDVMIFGCLFGTQPGQVRMIVNSSTGGYLALDPVQWTNDTIVARLPPNPGYLDQPAELQVIRQDGQTTNKIPVQFIQRRILKTFDVLAHLDAVAADCAQNTTSDGCRGGNFVPGSESFIGALHYTFCCSPVQGTDRWFIKLINGWQLCDAGLFIDLGLDTVAIPGCIHWDEIFQAADGYVDCGLYGDRPGELTAISRRVPDDPRWQGEIDVSFQVWAHCSGIRYWMKIFIVGPDGVPYD